ncbi:hypothetical protein Patl1_02983 [Pistacia atlantica]|uniref:Uncharacterized protein n=1 Tax=Pistacia atlantica TaxID=434234 RepID=A0ACC1CAI3_9ROSI|nr:hypothetical protein Patl1_02983 [Pistacia atlantica]
MRMMCIRFWREGHGCLGVQGEASNMHCQLLGVVFSQGPSSNLQDPDVIMGCSTKELLTIKRSCTHSKIVECA